MEDFQTIIDNFAFIYVDKKDKEKIIFKLDKKDTHYTIHFGTKSKVLDVHKTIELPDNKKNYETLAKINHFTIGRIFIVLKDVMEILPEYFFNHKTHPAFFKHHKIVGQSLSEDDLNNIQFLNINEKKGKMKFNKEDNFKSLEKLLMEINSKSKPAPYLLWKEHKGNLKMTGLLFIFINEHGNKVFYFISKNKYNKFLKIVFTKIMEALSNNKSIEQGLYSELAEMYSKKYNRNKIMIDSEKN